MNNSHLEIVNISGHKFILDKEARTITIRNPSVNQDLMINDTDGTISITDQSNDKILFDAKNKTLTVDFDMSVAIRVVNGSVTLSANNSSLVISTDNSGITISSGTSVTIDSPEIKLGHSATLSLVNEDFISLFNGHVHTTDTNISTSKPTNQAAMGEYSTKIIKGA
jgi:Tfp pilus assembly protein FimT